MLVCEQTFSISKYNCLNLESIFISVLKQIVSTTFDLFFSSSLRFDCVGLGWSCFFLGSVACLSSYKTFTFIDLFVSELFSFVSSRLI